MTPQLNLHNPIWIPTPRLYRHHATKNVRRSALGWTPKKKQGIHHKHLQAQVERRRISEKNQEEMTGTFLSRTTWHHFSQVTTASSWPKMQLWKAYTTTPKNEVKWGTSNWIPWMNTQLQHWQEESYNIAEEESLDFLGSHFHMKVRLFNVCFSFCRKEVMIARQWDQTDMKERQQTGQKKRC